MSFWNSFSWNNAASPIDTILGKESFTLTELLDEEEILSELKAQNQKLLDFLCKEETLLELSNYVVTESTDTTRGYKFAYLSSEIICVDNWKINEALFQFQSIWEKIFQFVYNTDPLPPINSSYFNKVASYLVSKKPNEIIIFLQSKNDFLQQILRHPGNTSIIEFLVKILLSVDNVDENRITKWFLESNLIPSLVEFFNRKNGEDIHENIANFFINLINQSAQVQSNSLELYNVLESEATLTTLFNNLLSPIEGSEKSSSLIHGVTVIIEIIKRNYSDVFDYSTQIDSLPAILRITLLNLEKFLSVITTFNENERFVATFGELKTPFGTERMKVLELLVCLISTRFVNLMARSIEFNLLQTCFDLFFKYAWNNILHIFVQQITVILLESYSPPILSFMFETVKVHEILAKAGNSEVEGTAYLRKGYMGVVALLAGVIENASNSNELIENALENSSEWQSYVKGDLFEMRKKESKPLGGVDRPQSAHSNAGGLSDHTDEDDDKSSDIGGLHTAIKFAFENGLPDDFAVKDFEDEEDLLSFNFNDTERLLAGLPPMVLDTEGGGMKFVNYFEDASDGDDL